MLTAPDHVNVIEFKASTMWVEEEGLVCVVLKEKKASRSVSDVKASIEKFKEATGHQKCGVLIDATHLPDFNYQVREYLGAEFPNLFSAMAVVSATPEGKLKAVAFFNMLAQPYPVRVF